MKASAVAFFFFFFFFFFFLVVVLWVCDWGEGGGVMPVSVTRERFAQVRGVSAGGGCTLPSLK